MIKSTLENDIFKRAFELVKKKLIKIIKMILPDKYDIDLMLGNKDGTFLYKFTVDNIHLEGYEYGEKIKKIPVAV